MHRRSKMLNSNTTSFYSYGNLMRTTCCQKTQDKWLQRCQNTLTLPEYPKARLVNTQSEFLHCDSSTFLVVDKIVFAVERSQHRPPSISEEERQGNLLNSRLLLAEPSTCQSHCNYVKQMGKWWNNSGTSDLMKSTLLKSIFSFIYLI